MEQSSANDREDYIKRLLPQITSLTDQLRDIVESGQGDYSKTFKELDELRKRYKELTGIYPVMPPSWKPKIK